MIHQSTESQQTQAFSNDYESVLPEHYRLIEMVGRGGMAEVFAAEDTRLNRRVAIKFLNSEFRRDPDRMRRFRHEAKAASALNHPNILTIHDIGESSGVQYLVSEFVEGETLGAKISRGAFPLSEAVEVALQVASALSASHAAGIVHRDIKPDNVMIRDDGVVKVLDFGLAKTRGFSTSNGVDFDAMTLDSGSTSPGLIVGTPQYMSPEQARGKELDGRTDIFSLGILLFEMVTRRSPFAGETFADTMAAILTKEPRRLEEYFENPPVRLIAIVSRALKKNRDERFPTMGEVVFELRQLRSELADNPSSFESRVVDTQRTEIRPTDQHSISQYFSEGLRKHPTAGVFVVLSGLIFLGLIWSYWAWPSSGTSASVLRSVPITNWSSSTGELVTAASFSPDSRMIAYAAASAGGTEIWIKPTDPGDSIQVTKGGSYNQYPVWSPNMREIAFFSSRGSTRGIWRVAYTGGQPTEIASGVSLSVRLVNWGRSGTIYLQDNYELWSLDEKSGKLSQITDFTGSGLKPRAIEVSGDESRIAFSIKEGETWKLYVAKRDLTGKIEYASSSAQIDDLAWHPDNESIVYSAQVEGRYQVFQSAGPGTQTQISNGDTDMHVQDVSADGSQILYGSVSETSDIWRVALETKRETPIANRVASEFWPDFSPDGVTIAYQSVASTERPYSGAIEVREDNKPARVVAASGFGPVWSFDGQAVSYLRKTGSGISIWRVGRDGEQAVKIAEGDIATPGYMVTPYLKLGSPIAWSPDNLQIAYSKRTDGISNLWTTNSSGGGERQMTNNANEKAAISSPIWSRDGSLILFSEDVPDPANPSGRVYRLSTAGFDDSQVKPIFESTSPFRILGFDENADEVMIARRSVPGERCAVCSVDILSVSVLSSGTRQLRTLQDVYYGNIYISYDGRSLAYVTRVNDVTALWTTPVRSGDPTQISEENDPKVLISSIAWSRDGKSIAFGRQTRTQSLALLSK